MKLAFIMPGHKNFVLPVVGGKVAARSILAEDAHDQGYVVAEWPEDKFGLALDSADLAAFVNAGASPDSATEAKWNRRVDLLNTKEARAANPEAVNIIRDADMSLDQKRAFLRGLPKAAAGIELTTEKENTVMQSNTTKEARLCEISLGILARRAEQGDHKARVTAQKVRSAALVAEATNKPLHTVLSELGITL